MEITRHVTTTHDDAGKRAHIGIKPCTRLVNIDTSKDDTELTQENWITARETLINNMQLTYWSAPLISIYSPHDMNTNTKILTLLLRSPLGGPPPTTVH